MPCVCFFGLSFEECGDDYVFDLIGCVDAGVC